MATKAAVIKAEVDRETEVDFSAWADREGRSKQRHAAILLRKLTTLKKSHPAELAKLGLLDQLANA